MQPGWIAAADFQTARGDGAPTAVAGRDFARIEKPHDTVLIGALAEGLDPGPAQPGGARAAVHAALEPLRARAAGEPSGAATAPRLWDDLRPAQPPAGARLLVFAASPGMVTAWLSDTQGARLVVRTAPAPGLGYRDLVDAGNGMVRFEGDVRFLAVLSSALSDGQDGSAPACAVDALDRFVTSAHGDRDLHGGLREFLRHTTARPGLARDAGLILGGWRHTRTAA